jgi:hypothetical protein
MFSKVLNSWAAQFICLFHEAFFKFKLTENVLFICQYSQKKKFTVLWSKESFYFKKGAVGEAGKSAK